VGWQSSFRWDVDRGRARARAEPTVGPETEARTKRAAAAGAARLAGTIGLGLEAADPLRPAADSPWAPAGLTRARQQQLEAEAVAELAAVRTRLQLSATTRRGLAAEAAGAREAMDEFIGMVGQEAQEVADQRAAATQSSLNMAAVSGLVGKCAGLMAEMKVKAELEEREWEQVLLAYGSERDVQFLLGKQIDGQDAGTKAANKWTKGRCGGASPRTPRPCPPAPGRVSMLPLLVCRRTEHAKAELQRKRIKAQTQQDIDGLQALIDNFEQRMGEGERRALAEASRVAEREKRKRVELKNKIRAAEERKREAAREEAVGRRRQLRAREAEADRKLVELAMAMEARVEGQRASQERKAEGARRRAARLRGGAAVDSRPHSLCFVRGICVAGSRWPLPNDGGALVQAQLDAEGEEWAEIQDQRSKSRLAEGEHRAADRKAREARREARRGAWEQEKLDKAARLRAEAEGAMRAEAGVRAEASALAWEKKMRLKQAREAEQQAKMKRELGTRREAARARQRQSASQRQQDASAKLRYEEERAAELARLDAGDTANPALPFVAPVGILHI
jgi:hypothetical protein